MIAGKREKGKIYLCRVKDEFEDDICVYLGKGTFSVVEFCPRSFSKYTGIKLKPGEMIEIEVRAKGGVE